MKQFIFAILCVVFALPCSSLRAGTFNSTSMLNQTFNQQILVFTRITDAALGINRSESISPQLSSGINSATISADTVSNSGSIIGLDFKQFSLPASSLNHDVSVRRLVVDVPGDFPDPGMSHYEDEKYKARVTITGVAPSTPIASSTIAPLQSLYFKPPWFVMNNVLTLSSLSFVIEGTFEAIGPTTTKSVPFSVEFRPEESVVTLLQRTGIKGGPDFDNGFEFILSRGIRIPYRAVTPVVFDEQIDGMRIQLNVSDKITVGLLKDAPLPEPGVMGLGFGVAAAISGRWRRRAMTSKLAFKQRR